MAIKMDKSGQKPASKRSILASFLRLFCGCLWLLCGVNAALASPSKLAIVIDDIGYRAKEDEAIYRLPKAVSVAIIPAAPNATARAEQAYAQQREILIHLPMQPQSASQPIEAGALRVGMDRESVARLIASAKAKVPYAIGLNNHMGSRATTDRPTMSHLMHALSAENLFFLDSKTAGNSVGVKVAQEFGIKALERHIFLDDSDALDDVKRQFQQAVSFARKNGVAVMIGHPRKHSIAVLQQGIANLPADIELVSIGSLWRAEKVVPEKPFHLQFVLEAATSSTPPFETVPLLRGLPKD